MTNKNISVGFQIPGIKEIIYHKRQVQVGIVMIFIDWKQEGKEEKEQKGKDVTKKKNDVIINKNKKIDTHKIIQVNIFMRIDK